jgi:hypothetical protein
MRKKLRLLRLVNELISPLGVRLDLSSTYRSSVAVALDETARLDALQDVLTPRLEFAILGSIDERFSIPSNLAGAVRTFSLDAVAPGEGQGRAGGAAVVPVKQVIAGSAGAVRFVQRTAPGVSSILEPKAELIGLYGLDRLYGVEQVHRVDAITLGDLGRMHHVERWDYIRTDLEGADFAIVQSLGDDLRSVSLLEMELRAEPFYRDEPPMHAVMAHLAEHGFEVLDLKPERWRARTSHMHFETRGRVTFCNAVFVNRAIEARSPRAILRHALILGMMGYANFAERILRPLESSHASEVRALQALLFGRATERYLPFPKLPHLTHGTGD